jgi:hypothetical protein
MDHKSCLFTTYFGFKLDLDPLLDSVIEVIFYALYRSNFLCRLRLTNGSHYAVLPAIIPAVQV